MDHKEEIKERLKILPEGLRTFITDEEWRKDAEKISKQFFLNEESYISFENEVFLVLLCFEPRADFIQNIQNELKADGDTAQQIASETEKNIFSRVASELSAIEKQMEENEKEKTVPVSRVGGSFEKIILNQAKAMQPARPAGYVPQNLPTNEPPKAASTGSYGETKKDEPRAIHNYIGGSDPYREPIE